MLTVDEGAAAAPARSASGTGARRQAPTAADAATGAAPAKGTGGESRPTPARGASTKELAGRRAAARRETRSISAVEGRATSARGAPARPGRGCIGAGRARAQRRRPVPAAPSTRRTARELGLDITAGRGTGPGGRISVDDVKAHAREVITGAAAAACAGSGGDAARLQPWGEVESQPMRTIRRKTAERMATAWATVPHVTQGDKADITELEKLRQNYAKTAEKAGGKLTITAIALKVVASALRKFPQFNARSTWPARCRAQEVRPHRRRGGHRARAARAGHPRRGPEEHRAALGRAAQLADKAKARKLSPEEMEGGSFTISNLGGIGGTYFTPIVNVPEVAILGMSRSVTEPVWNGTAVRAAADDAAVALLRSPRDRRRRRDTLPALGLRGARAAVLLSSRADRATSRHS